MIDKKTWMRDTAAQAKVGGHVWPDYAAAEAALESNFGQSQLATLANNLFGQKMSAHPQYGQYGVLDLPTREFINGEWIETVAHWISYPDLAACFRDRMATLTRLRVAYPHYGAALSALNGETYVREVSQTWSTDPHRADAVLAVYKEFFG